MLNILLEHADSDRVIPHFLDYTDRGGAPPHPVYRASLWERHDDASPAPPVGMTALIEALCSGTHGPVLGYEWSPRAAYEPVLASPQSHPATQRHLGALRRGLDDYLGKLALRGTRCLLDELPVVQKREALSRAWALTNTTRNPGHRSSRGRCPGGQLASTRSSLPPGGHPDSAALQHSCEPLAGVAEERLGTYGSRQTAAHLAGAPYRRNPLMGSLRTSHPAPPRDHRSSSDDQIGHAAASRGARWASVPLCAPCSPYGTRPTLPHRWFRHNGFEAAPRPRGPR